MVFSSVTFLFIFIPLVLLLYFLVKNITIRNIILCIFSIVFYAWGEPVYIFLMLFTILSNYILVIKMDKNKKPKSRKVYLIITIVLDLLILFFFKYSNFLITNINNLFNLNIKYFHLALTIGISFYTFQTLSYVIDVYRRKVNAEKNIVDFAAFVVLF